MKPFFIALNSQNTSGGIDINPENEPLLRAMNRNMFYYYFCVDIKDFIFQKPRPEDEHSPLRNITEVPVHQDLLSLLGFLLDGVQGDY